MRITLLLLFVLTFQLQAEQIYSQDAKISLDMKNATIEKVLQTIEEKSDYYFLYNSRLINVDREVSVRVKNAPIYAVLEKLFKSENVEFEVKGSQIILSPKEMYSQITAVANALQQQKKTITGTITDASGVPLPGVTVVLKGTTQGTVTDVDGNYSLANIPEDATLVFSFVGMETQEVEVAGKSIINVTMAEEAIRLEEVVAVGYGTMRRSDLTGSVVRASSEMFEERPNVSALQSLQGAIPGLNVGQVTDTGESPSFSIRGRTSISGALSPLVVVDNVIFRGNLIDLNPNDIESVDILKDSSASAIYGSQAANGVIIITTKKGKKSDKAIINYFADYSYKKPAKEFEPESPDEFIQRIADADLYNSRTAESGYLQPVPDYDPSVWFKNNEQINAYRNGNTTDWHDLLTNDYLYTQNHNLSISNRSQKSGYFISLGYTDDVGYMVNDGYNRWSARINIDNTITNWLEVGIQSFLTVSDYSGPNISPSEIWDHIWYAPAYDENGELVAAPRGVGSLNPLFATEAKFERNRVNLFGNIYAQIDIPFIKGLSFKTNYSNNSRLNNRYEFHDELSNFKGKGSKEHTIDSSWSNDNIITYKKDFGESHSINLTLVYGVEKSESSYTMAEASDFADTSLGYNRLQAGNSELQSVTTGAWEESSLYNVARFFYGYKNKYLFTGTVRRDGFSGFSKAHKFGIFPSAAFAWVASEESFLADINWLNMLKIRLSYGSNGNRTIGRYQTLAKVSGGYHYLDESHSPVYTQHISGLASPNLKWETTTGINLAFDYGVLNNRVNGSFEYYNNNTRNLLYNVDLPSISRYSKFPDNLGRIHNHGFEFTLSSLNIDKGRNGLRWTSSLSFSLNRNELKELLGFDNDGDGKEDDLISEGLFIGESLSTIYNFVTDGSLWQLGDNIPSTADVGSFIIKDISGEGEITRENDRTIIGCRDPLFRFGIENKFDYKNWALSFFLNSIQGNKNYYLGKDDLTDFNTINQEGLFNRTFPRGMDYWLPENPDARYQKLYINVPNGLQATRWISRSFVRLQDVTLSYNFEPDFLKKVNIQNLKLFFNGKNLFTWTKWPGWDPETGDGIVRNARPVLRNYTFGINVKF